MATRRFCDLCGKDITHSGVQPVPVSIGLGKPGTHWASEGSTWVRLGFAPNPPDMCETCLRKAEKKAAKAILAQLVREEE